MTKISTSNLKKAYRKGVLRLRTETDPLRRQMLLRFTYAIKVDLSRRIRFKGAKKSLWRRAKDTYSIAKKLNEPYTENHLKLSHKEETP